MNDEQLIALCKNGEKWAFEELIKRYYLPLNKYFYKLLHDPKTCEDLVHDVIIKLIENIEKYKPLMGVKFSTWLFKIAYNTYVDFIRKNPRGKEIELEESLFECPSTLDVHDKVIKNIEVDNLLSMLDKLPEEMRTLIVLRYLREFSYSDIGKIMGISTIKVKWKLHNSMEKLRIMMSKNTGGVNYGA